MVVEEHSNANGEQDGGGHSRSDEGGGALSPSNYNPASPVLHVVVVGFHHKKGCQVEYAYPPLIPGGECFSNELPSQWKNLPSLALPDGSHNFVQDTVFFHLPALHDPRQTVFGISCYRQIDAEKVKNRTEDITRGTVQKSVCVLSRLPLFGQIQVKMSLITQAYFEEGDFLKTELIRQTYENLNDCLSDDMLHSQQLYVGLSARDFITRYKQKSLQLFKLLLLERKVIFFKSPVSELSGDILTLLSLLPGQLEAGLQESACIVPVDTPEDTPENSLHHEEATGQDAEAASVASISPSSSIGSILPQSESIQSLSSRVKDRVSGALGYIAGPKSPTEEAGAEIVEEAKEGSPTPPTPSFSEVTALSLQELEYPLNLFTAGNLCHPYLSLPYLDILMQPSIHGYTIGATNALFKAKSGLADVLIEIEEDKLEVYSPELRRAVNLTTEDLRFIDNVIKVVSEDCKDKFLEGVGWEGGDEWVRAQFRCYLTCMLRTSLESRDKPVIHHFNSNFYAALDTTHWYRAWKKNPPVAIQNLDPGHPCTGQLSVADVKLRLSHTMTNTEGGKKVTAAMASTGRAVAESSKVVAGGLGAAKGVLSSWWGGLRQDKKSPSPPTLSPVHQPTTPSKSKQSSPIDETKT